MRQTIWSQTLRYALVGGIVYACDFLVFMIVVLIDERLYLVGNVASKALSALLGFFLHKHITFSWKQRDGVAQQLTAYVLLLGFNTGLSSFLLWVTVAQLGMYEPLAKIFVDAVVIAVNFVASRWFVYRPA